MIETQVALATDQYGDQRSKDRTVGWKFSDSWRSEDISGLIDARNRGGRGTEPSESNSAAFSNASAAHAQEAGVLGLLADQFRPLPRGTTRRSTLHPLQEWEGSVVEIGDEEFTGRLTDLTAGHSYETEEAVVPLEELSDHDRAKLRKGSIFRWVIGYERSPSGTKRRVSQIVFRDLPAMTESDFRSGAEWARGIARSFQE